MTLRRSRTLLAALLVCATIALPCAAWFVAGSYLARQDARRMVFEADRGARETLAKLAIRLDEQLERLRRVENARPFYHFQNLYHDPQGASSGPSVVRSPLAQAPMNPVVRAYFQVDPQRRISLPTLNDEIPSLCAKSCEQLQREIKTGLSCPRGTCNEPTLAVYADASRAVQVDHVEVLDRSAWLQNLRATELYAGLRDGNRKLPAGIEGAAGDVLIRVGGFEWLTVPIAGRATLLAARVVDTPIGRFVQGILIDEQELAQQFGAAVGEMQLLPRAAGRGLASLPIGDTGWIVAQDNSATMTAAEERGRGRYAQFLRTFSITVALVSLGGLGIVLVVRQADRLAQQRSRFAAAAAHELRTPLAGLQMYGEMLAEGLGDVSRQREYARRIASEAERLGRVVANVNQFSQLERGSLSLKTENGDLVEAVRQCVERQRPTLEAAGAAVDLTIHGAVAAARFDRDAVGHIVQNLLDNAEKYSRRSPQRSIRVSLQEETDAVVLTVADSGPGIPPPLRRSLFEPFARGSDPDAPAGLGLGLALTRALARAQGGEVELSEAASPGAEFRVRFARTA